MKFTRILSLVLVVLMLLGCLISCDTKEEANNDGQTPDQGAAVVENVELQLVNTGAPQYVIVYDYKAGPQTKNAIIAMVDAFKEYLNCEVETRECYSDRKVEEAANRSPSHIVKTPTYVPLQP